MFGLDERAAGMRLAHRHDLIWCPHTDDGAAGLSTLGTQIDDPVGGPHHIHIVFDYQQRMSGVDQASKRTQQLGHVLEVQSRGRLVEEKEGAPLWRGVRNIWRRVASCAALFVRGLLADRILGEVSSQFQPLSFAAGESRDRLTEAQIVEPHVLEWCQTHAHLGVIGEKCQRLGDREIEYIGDALRRRVAARELQLEDLGPIATTVAIRTAQVYIRQELHLDVFEAVSAASRAPTVA